MSFLKNLFSKKQSSTDSVKATQKPKLVDPREEEPKFLAALVANYGKGKELNARDSFLPISDGYEAWYAKQAEKKNVYLASSTKSATLELLESLLAKRLLRNKRKAVRNNYGDEDWYYTLN